MKILGLTISRDSLVRAVRTFIPAFAVILIPGLLGWLNALTDWAQGQGSTPFPDAHGLAYLGVSAIVAGVVAVLNLIWNAIEDATGKGLLRTPPSPVIEKRKAKARKAARTEKGAVRLPALGASRDRHLPGKKRIRARRSE